MMTLTIQEHSTILAALRHYQSDGMHVPENRPDWLSAIATNDYSERSLDGSAIDALCEKLNCGFPWKSEFSI